VLANRNRLLVLMFQFPISFKFAVKDRNGELVRLEGNWDHVADVLNAFKAYPAAIEFRHESWNDPSMLRALREHETAWVNIDEPRMGRRSTEPSTSRPLWLTSGCTAAITRSGSTRRTEMSDDYLYSREELAPIAKSLDRMEKKVDREPTRREVRKVAAATNNHYKGKAVVNAVDLKHLLGVKDNPVPDELQKKYPHLKFEAERR
jgi:uncharacterized protein YecE (DUF72 family)